MALAPNLIIGLPVLDATETFRSLLDAAVATTESQDTAHSAGFIGTSILAERLVIGLPALDAAETLSTTLDVRIVATEHLDIPDFAIGVAALLTARIAVVEQVDVFAAAAEPVGDILKASENADVVVTEGEVLNQPVRPKPLRTDALKESVDILHRLLTNILRSAKAPSIREGSKLRLLVGSIIADGQLVFAYPTTTLADDLLECFTLAVGAGATVDSMDYVRRKVMEETPQSYLATAMVQLGLCYCLSSEARLVAAIEFKSRDTVEIMLARMNDAFDEAEIFAADEVDAPSYRAVIELHAAITRDLVSKSRPLARMVDYDFKDVTPSLWLANRLYGDASRSGELIDENHVVHPAFAQPVGRCLSN